MTAYKLGPCSRRKTPSSSFATVSKLNVLSLFFDPTLQNEFSDLDEMLVGHFYEEENTLIGALRKAITPKEQMKHIGKPIGGSMSWAERGQFFSKLSPDTLKVFIKQEGCVFIFS